ncbi:HEPN domain-containing protein [Hoeflea sp. CAU 1731]
MADQQTTPLGLFNYAESYWQSAVALQKARVQATHAASPVLFLYYHAVELYLKACLHGNGISIPELRKNFGHSALKLAVEAQRYGIQFDEEDMEVFSYMTDTDAVIDSRYLRTGYFNRPTHEALDRTCQSIRQLIGTALKKKGYSVHWI